MKLRIYLWLIVALWPAVITASPAQVEPRIEELRWVDEGFLQRQRALVDDLGRGEFGTPLRGDLSDLRLLQRILDQQLINRTETAKLQALGVALGDVYVKELNMQWRTYSDQDGKSRAVCIPNSSHCLFPVTMISKRASLGVVPQVEELYQRGVAWMRPYLPKRPYSSTEP